MKKKAYVILLLIFVLSVFFSSSLLANDSIVVSTSENASPFIERAKSFFVDLMPLLFKLEIAEDSEKEVDPKKDESKVERRGHRIRIPSSKDLEKKEPNKYK